MIHNDLCAIHINLQLLIVGIKITLREKVNDGSKNVNRFY